MNQHSIQHQHHHRNFDQSMLDKFLHNKAFDLIDLYLKRNIQHLQYRTKTVLYWIDRCLHNKALDRIGLLSKQSVLHQNHRKKIVLLLLDKCLLHNQWHTLQNLMVHICQQVNQHKDISRIDQDYKIYFVLDYLENHQKYLMSRLHLRLHLQIILFDSFQDY